MPDTKISALDEETVLDPADEFIVVKKGDTSMAASGTDKRITAGSLDDRWDQSGDIAALASIAALTAAKAALAGVYHTILKTSGRLTTAGLSGKGYYLLPGQADQIAEPGDAGRTNINTTGNSQLVVLGLLAADLAVSGLTAKLRLKVGVGVPGTGMGRDITFGLYPLTISSQLITFGGVVSGSTVTIASATLAANGFYPDKSADFSLPGDGPYIIGYTLSGAPASNCNLQAAVQAHAV